MIDGIPGVANLDTRASSRPGSPPLAWSKVELVIPGDASQGGRPEPVAREDNAVARWGGDQAPSSRPWRKVIEEKMPSGRRNGVTRTMMSRTMPCNVSTCSLNNVDQKKGLSFNNDLNRRDESC